MLRHLSLLLILCNLLVFACKQKNHSKESDLKWMSGTHTCSGSKIVHLTDLGKWAIKHHKAKVNYNVAQTNYTIYKNSDSSDSIRKNNTEEDFLDKLYAARVSLGGVRHQIKKWLTKEGLNHPIDQINLSDDSTVVSENIDWKEVRDCDRIQMMHRF